MKFSQQTLREVTDEENNFVECPECGYDDSDSSRGIAMHFAYNHEGSLKYLFECEICGRLKFGHGQSNSYCSKYCEIYDQTGTFKHMNEEFLREQVHEKGKSDKDIAEEIGVNRSLVSKHIRRFEIGSEHECPKEDCDRAFVTLIGMKQHHESQHGESISGFEHECEWCGDTFTVHRSKNCEHPPKYCPPSENDNGCYAKSIEGENSPAKDPETRKKLSKNIKKAWEEGVGDFPEGDNREWMMENVINKRDDSYLHEEPSEETKEKLSEAAQRLVEQEEHPFQDPEVRKKIVETRNENGSWDWYPEVSPEEAQKRSVEAREDYGPKKWDSDLTGHTLDSKWELEVDEMLYQEDIDYIRNGSEETVEFELDYGKYIPDFIVRDGDKPIVVEVKGWLGYNYDQEKVESFAREMAERDDLLYVVYGDVELESDIYVEYGNEGKLCQAIEGKVNQERSVFDY